MLIIVNRCDLILYHHPGEVNAIVANRKHAHQLVVRLGPARTASALLCEEAFLPFGGGGQASTRALVLFSCALLQVEAPALTLWCWVGVQVGRDRLQAFGPRRETPFLRSTPRGMSSGRGYAHMLCLCLIYQAPQGIDRLVYFIFLLLAESLSFLCPLLHQHEALVMCRSVLAVSVSQTWP